MLAGTGTSGSIVFGSIPGARSSTEPAYLGSGLVYSCTPATLNIPSSLRGRLKHSIRPVASLAAKICHRDTPSTAVGSSSAQNAPRVSVVTNDSFSVGS